MEKVSIITPCYNSAKYLNDTVKSVLDQTYTNWEWIICDDGSTDESLSVLESFKDDRILILKNKQNSGAAVSRNNALKNATGRYITFLDSDDVWFPHFLETSISYLLEHDEQAVYATYKRYDEDLNPYLDDFEAIDFIDYNRMLHNCPTPMLTSIYDSNKIGKVYFPLVELREDHAMWLDLLKHIPHIRAIKEPLAIYRIRKGSYSRNKWDIAKKSFAMYRKHLKMSLPKALYYTSCWALNGVQKYWIGRKNKDE